MRPPPEPPVDEAIVVEAAIVETPTAPVLEELPEAEAIEPEAESIEVEAEPIVFDAVEPQPEPTAIDATDLEAEPTVQEVIELDVPPSEDIGRASMNQS
jgi:hypothetical protein